MLRPTTHPPFLPPAFPAPCPQELLDVTRQLLADMERQQKAAARGPDGGAAGEEERDQLVGSFPSKAKPQT
jgi:hypothetical protein